MVGVPALITETFSCSYPKHHRARTHKPEVNKHRYVTEYDPATGEAFGLVEGFADEWGYFSVREMEALNRSRGFNVVERDVLFEPAPVSRVRR